MKILLARLLNRVVLLLTLLCPLVIFSNPYQDLESIRQTKMKGEAAQRRLSAWLKLINQSKKLSEIKKLNNVNQFFNMFHYQRDNPYQGTSDAWKTPEEFIQDGAGDCEDYAIAKYFTLQALGVPMQKLRITYVKSLKFNQAHMVLAFYPDPDSEPLILDNVENKILPASQRKDLIPVYSFNTDELWLSRPMGTDRYLGANNLKKWRVLLQRMKKGDMGE